MDIAADYAKPPAMRSIAKGNAPERILRTLAYEVEGAAPLTLGTGIEGVRQERDAGYIGEQVAGQFLGTSSRIPSKTRELTAKWEDDFEDYNALPTTRYGTKGSDAKKTLTRDAYRKKYPDVEAKLFITGAVTSLSTDAAKRAAVQLMKDNNLTVKDIKSLDVRDDDSPPQIALRAYFEKAFGEAPAKRGKKGVAQSAPVAPTLAPPPMESIRP